MNEYSIYIILLILSSLIILGILHLSITYYKHKKLIKLMAEELKYQYKKVLEKDEIIERYEVLSGDQRQIIDELWTEKERADNASFFKET